MQIKSIKVSNFKSFEELEVDLRRFNVLIGANASGKSNFLSIFYFLKDICTNDLEDAISMQGGVDFIRNINIGSSKNLLIEIQFESKGETIKFATPEKRVEVSINPSKWIYNFSVEFLGSKRYRVSEESLVVNFDFMEELTNRESKKGEKKAGIFTFYRDRNGVTYELDAEGTEMKKEYLVPPSLSKKKFLSKELSIGYPVSLFHIVLNEYCNLISLYDFDPKLSKEAISITGKTELEQDGKNLAVVLKGITDDKQKNEKFHDLIKELLPFIDTIKVDKFADKYLLTSLKEVYSGKKFFAPLISDGTINIAAFIIALHFEKKPIIIIEEPERNIHPYLISKIIAMMVDVSDRLKRQIIVTTHNPEVVRYAGIENILLLQRNEKGFSQISKPSEKEEVKIFLENNMGIDKLYLQNLLE